MPRVAWLLQSDYPVIQLQLWDPATGHVANRTVLADTGAGPNNSPIELFLSDCQRFGKRRTNIVTIGGAITGTFSSYSMWIEIPPLSVVRRVRVVAVPPSEFPIGLDGIASFRFLNRFTYGNFGDPNQFGLETP